MMIFRTHLRIPFPPTLSFSICPRRLVLLWPALFWMLWFPADFTINSRSIPQLRNESDRLVCERFRPDVCGILVVMLFLSTLFFW